MGEPVRRAQNACHVLPRALRGSAAATIRGAPVKFASFLWQGRETFALLHDDYLYALTACGRT